MGRAGRRGPPAVMGDHRKRSAGAALPGKVRTGASPINYTDHATTVTQQLVAQIELSPGTGRMPWHTVPGLFDVRNASTGNRYRGANVVSLALDAIEAEHPTRWWSTYRHWSDLGAQVRKGERSTRIVKFVLAMY